MSIKTSLNVLNCLYELSEWINRGWGSENVFNERIFWILPGSIFVQGKLKFPEYLFERKDNEKDKIETMAVKMPSNNFFIAYLLFCFS